MSEQVLPKVTSISEDGKQLPELLLGEQGRHWVQGQRKLFPWKEDKCRSLAAFPAWNR